jgi:hypothetical protein
MSTNVKPRTGKSRYVRLGVEVPDDQGRLVPAAGPDMLKLVEHTPIYMFSTMDAATDKRFAEVFAAVWAAVPADEQQQMLGHWANGPKSYGLPAPRIALLADWTGRGKCLGECSLLGHEIRFDVAIVATATADMIACLVAQELAHVWQFAVDRMGERRRAAIEREADEIAFQWLIGMPDIGAGSNGDVRWSVREARRWLKEHPTVVIYDRLFAEQGWFITNAVRQLTDRAAHTGEMTHA